MSEPDQSGTPPAAPADSPAAPAPSAPAAASTPPTGAFGTTRGSGLARGKRPAPVSAAASATPAGYKPTAVEVITPQREYKNPFTGETTVSAPPANEPAPQAATVTEAPAPAPAAPPPAPAEKAELNILPPEPPKRPVVGWEAPKPAPTGDAPRREERGSFRPDRRDERRDERKFEPREPRREERQFEPRAQQPYQPREQRGEPEKKPAGLVGWFKGLFGGKKPDTTPASGERREGEQGGQHRHRGGRGRGGYRGDDRGPREGQPYQGGGEQHGEPRGEGDGFRRRRRRGGRGRHRGEGGDRGPRDPRPEGQQGGGAI